MGLYDLNRLYGKRPQQDEYGAARSVSPLAPAQNTLSSMMGYGGTAPQAAPTAVPPQYRAPTQQPQPAAPRPMMPPNPFRGVGGDVGRIPLPPPFNVPPQDIPLNDVPPMSPPTQDPNNPTVGRTNPQFPQPPAPPSQPPAQSPEEDIRAKFLAQLLGYIQNPSRYGQKVVSDTFNAGQARLQEGFDVQRQDVDTDLARRGLFYSTEVAGRKGDIAGQQAKAEADLMSQIQQDQARTYGQDVNQALQTVMGYGQNQFSNQMSIAQLNMMQDQDLRNFLMQLLGQSSGGGNG